MKNMKKFAFVAATVVLAIAVFAIDNGAECGAYPKRVKATVTVAVTLDNGHVYLSEEERLVTVNTYGSDDPEDWEVTTR